jgi:hypothetical protein
MTRADKRFEAFCFWMIVVCVLGAVIVGYFQYNFDQGVVSNGLPGCRSGRYVCHVSFRHGRAFVEMVPNTTHE